MKPSALHLHPPFKTEYLLYEKPEKKPMKATRYEAMFSILKEKGETLSSCCWQTDTLPFSPHLLP
jgi:hypothetical protein